MAELIPVNILIGDRTYRLRIEPKDEETLRRNVKLINDKIIEFKTDFAGKDMQDFIAMVLIWFSTEQTNSVLAEPGLMKISGKLSELEQIIDNALFVMPK